MYARRRSAIRRSKWSWRSYPWMRSNNLGQWSTDCLLWCSGFCSSLLRSRRLSAYTLCCIHNVDKLQRTGVWFSYCNRRWCWYLRWYSHRWKLWCNCGWIIVYRHINSFTTECRSWPLAKSRPRSQCWTDCDHCNLQQLCCYRAVVVNYCDWVCWQCRKYYSFKCYHC